jgi:hypothetical protein
MSILAAVSILAFDAIRAFQFEEPGWNYVVVVIDILAIALFALLHRRSLRITELARSVALIWGLFGIGSVLLFSDLSKLGPRYLTVALAAEGVILLMLYFVMKLPSSKQYLARPPASTSLERTRGE